MTRKSFITAIAALFAAPFLPKKKENEDWKKSNPRLIVGFDPVDKRTYTAIVARYDVPDEFGNVLQKGCFKNLEEQQIKFQHDVINPILRIRDEDIWAHFKNYKQS